MVMVVGALAVQTRGSTLHALQLEVTVEPALRASGLPESYNTAGSGRKLREGIRRRQKLSLVI